MAAGSTARRALLVLALLVPLAMDPFGADTQGWKAALLALAGGLLLALDGAAALAGRPVPRATAPEVVLALLAAWAAASLAWAGNPALGASRVLLLVGMLGLARGVRAEVTDVAAGRRWMRALLLAAGAAVALDAVLVLVAPEPLPGEAAKHASQVFVHNNMAASFAMTLAPLLVAAVLGAAGWRRALAWLVGLAGLLAYLGLLDSRAGLLGALLAVLAVGALFLLRPRLLAAGRPGRRLVIGACVLVLLGAVAPLSDGVRGLAKDAWYAGVKLSGIELQDVSFRQILWRKTLEMAARQPLAGVGAGNFPVEFPRHERLTTPKPHAHNDALQVLAELGVPGLLLFLGLLASLALWLARGLAGPADAGRFALLAGLAGLLVTFIAGGLFEVPFALGATAAHLAWAIGFAGALSSPGPPVVATRARAAGALALLAGLLAAGVTLWRLPASWLMRRAATAEQEGRLDDAIASYGRAAGLCTGAYHPLRMGALLQRRSGRREAALADIGAARGLAPFSSELLVDEGDILSELGRHAEAVESYGLAQRLSPKNEEIFARLMLALARSGQAGRAIDELEQFVRQDTGIRLDYIIKLADMTREHADTLAGAAQELAWVRSRHWYAVVAQEDPARRAALDPIFKDLTHRLQSLHDGQPDPWFQGTYRRWLDQGGWGIPGPALWLSLGDESRRLYPGWELPPEAFATGSWRQPSVWQEP